MRILLIAPNHPELNTPLEIEHLGQGHQVIALTGVIDQERLTRATTDQRYDAIHVASHCVESQIVLSNGDALTREQLGQIGRKVRCNLIFLNACDSAQLAQSLIDVGIPVVIAWTIPVLDADGIRTASFFYDELSHNQADLQNAYRKVSPRDGSFLFLAGDGFIDNLIAPITQRLDNFGQQISYTVQQITIVAKQLTRQRIALVAATALLIVILALAAYLALHNNALQAADPASSNSAVEPPLPTHAPIIAGPSTTPVVEPPTPYPPLIQVQPDDSLMGASNETALSTLATTAANARIPEEGTPTKIALVPTARPTLLIITTPVQKLFSRLLPNPIPNTPSPTTALPSPPLPRPTTAQDDSNRHNRHQAQAAIPTDTLVIVPTGGPTDTPALPTDTPVSVPSDTPVIGVPPGATDTPVIAPSDTPVIPTDTPVIPTDTPVIPTDTPVIPTDTPMTVLTDTPAAPTDTPVIVPTDTTAPPTDTPVIVPSDTPTPTPEFTEGPTNTPVPTDTPTPIVEPPTRRPTHTPTEEDTPVPTVEPPTPVVEPTLPAGPALTPTGQAGISVVEPEPTRRPVLLPTPTAEQPEDRPTRDQGDDEGQKPKQAIPTPTSIWKSYPTPTPDRGNDEHSTPTSPCHLVTVSPCPNPDQGDDNRRTPTPTYNDDDLENRWRTPTPWRTLVVEPPDYNDDSNRYKTATPTPSSAPTGTPSTALPTRWFGDGFDDHLRTATPKVTLPPCVPSLHKSEP